MKVKLVFAPEFEQDIDEAYAWYEDQRRGLGEEFLGCVDACIQGIVRTPELHTKVHQNYRRALVRRFPFVVFYEFRSDTVTVYSVFHSSRDPDKWRKRLP